MRQKHLGASQWTFSSPSTSHLPSSHFFIFQPPIFSPLIFTGQSFSFLNVHPEFLNFEPLDFSTDSSSSCHLAALLRWGGSRTSAASFSQNENDSIGDRKVGNIKSGSRSTGDNCSTFKNAELILRCFPCNASTAFLDKADWIGERLGYSTLVGT